MNFKREKYIYHSIILLVAKILLLQLKLQLIMGVCMNQKKRHSNINSFRFSLRYLQLSTCE